MQRMFKAVVFSLSLLGACAQQEGTLETDTGRRPGRGPADTDSPAAFDFEDSFEDCGDGEDQDGDGHIDCEDQDCEIYAMCVGSGSDDPADTTAPETDAEFETGCGDETDNDGDTFVDCDTGS